MFSIANSAVTGRLLLQFPNNTDEWLLPVPVDDSPERRSEVETEINGWRNNMMKFVFDERRKEAGRIFAQWWNGDGADTEIETKCPHLRDSLTNVCGAIDVLFNELFPIGDERVVSLDDFFSDALCQSDNIFVWLLIRDFAQAISRQVSFDLSTLTPPTPASPASSDDENGEEKKEEKQSMEVESPSRKRKAKKDDADGDGDDDPKDKSFRVTRFEPPANTSGRPRRERHAPSRYGFDDND